MAVIWRRVHAPLNIQERIHEDLLIRPPVPELRWECRQLWWQVVPSQRIWGEEVPVAEQHANECVDRTGQIQTHASTKCRAGECLKDAGCVAGVDFGEGAIGYCVA